MPVVTPNPRRGKYQGLNVSWLWMNHVPAEFNLSEEERRELKRLMRGYKNDRKNYPQGRGQFTRMMLVLMIPLSLLFTLGVWMLATRQLPMPFRVTSGRYVMQLVVASLGFDACVWMVITYAIFRSNQPYVRMALNKMGYPICVECGYVRVGLAERELCPECGAGIEQMMKPSGDTIEEHAERR